MAWLPLGAPRPASSQATTCDRFGALPAMSRARPGTVLTPRAERSSCPHLLQATRNFVDELVAATGDDILGSL
eukprot:5001989-Prymnesium_polylepis.1